MRGARPAQREASQRNFDKHEMKVIVKRNTTNGFKVVNSNEVGKERYTRKEGWWAISKASSQTRTPMGLGSLRYQPFIVLFYFTVNVSKV